MHAIHMSQFSLRYNLIQVQDFRQIADHIRGIYRTDLRLIKNNQKLSTCNGNLDLNQFNPKSPLTQGG